MYTKYQTPFQGITPMSNAQPANTNIAIYRTLRTRTVVDRFASIKEVAQGMGVRQVMIPGQEISCYNVLDHSFKSDAWRYGHPVVVETREKLTVSDLYASAAGLAFPIHLVGFRGDLFIANTAAAIGNDLQQEARTAGPGPAGLFRLV